MNLDTRCNWCSKPMLFHTAFMTRWHRLLCKVARLPAEYDRTPIPLPPVKSQRCAIHVARAEAEERTA